MTDSERCSIAHVAHALASSKSMSHKKSEMNRKTKGRKQRNWIRRKYFQIIKHIFKAYEC